jgi:hypothetical protein
MYKALLSTHSIQEKSIFSHYNTAVARHNSILFPFRREQYFYCTIQPYKALLNTLSIQERTILYFTIPELFKYVHSTADTIRISCTHRHVSFKKILNGRNGVSE